MQQQKEQPHIRDFRPEDRSKVISLFKAFYRSPAVLHTVPEDHFYKTFDLALTQPDLVRGVLFENDAEIVGYALLAFSYSNEAGGLVVWLEELYILEDARGHGLGTAFFRFLAKEYGDACLLRLEVTPNNLHAIHLYEKLGFTPLRYLQMARDVSLS